MKLTRQSLALMFVLGQVVLFVAARDRQHNTVAEQLVFDGDAGKDTNQHLSNIRTRIRHHPRHQQRRVDINESSSDSSSGDCGVSSSSSSSDDDSSDDENSGRLLLDGNLPSFSSSSSSQDGCDDVIDDPCPNGFALPDGGGDMTACQPESCITITVNDQGYDELYSYCDSHYALDDKCCSDDLAPIGVVKTRTEGNNVCSGWLADQAVTICKGSCVGLNACLGSQFQSGSSVGEYACRDGTGNSCQNIRSPVPGGSLVTINNNACQGYYACGDIEGEIVTIGEFSCVGYTVCEGIASAIAVDDDTENSVVIGSRSCLGEDSCNGLGLVSSTILIGSDACVSNDEAEQECCACELIGADNATSITIGNSACDGDLSCTYVGQETATDVFIGEMACRGSGTCFAVGSGEATTVNIDAEACNNFDDECDFCGDDMPGHIIIIANDNDVVSDCPY